MTTDGEPVSTDTLLRFIQASGRANVRADLDNLLQSGKRSLEIAVAFFTKAGSTVLTKHLPNLRREESFIVASVDFPTNLDALCQLHFEAPGHVYIHLGGVTPYEVDTAMRSLMHSKVYLASDGDVCRLWVGSHNMTASALEGGNYEAGVIVRATADYRLMAEARCHLRNCRDSAELFDPSRLEEYKRIQKKRAIPVGGSRKILVIHAESEHRIDRYPFILHVKIPHEAYDADVSLNLETHLHLYPPGWLSSHGAKDAVAATKHVGMLTTVGYTALNTRIQGTNAELPGAGLTLDVEAIPVIRDNASSRVRPHTQAALRLDSGSEDRNVMYARKREQTEAKLLGTQHFMFTELDPDMAPYFSEASVRDRQLVYEPALEFRQQVKAETYERSALPQDMAKHRLTDDTRKFTDVAYEFVQPENPSDPFFFISRYQI